MKRAYLIHGWEGRPDHGFFPWLRTELVRRGYAVEAPLMPDADAPSPASWMPFLEGLVGMPDEETVLVGHSMGGQAALRWLERLPEGARVGKVILVAPVVDAITGMGTEEEAVARPWLERAFDDKKIRRFAERVVGIFSDDDRWIPLASERIVRDRFGIQTVVRPARGHFSGDDGCTDLPEILPYL